ncbi:hypothetical protein [Antarcticirhabdus aurantiaca]|uniref:hypothetical protein n=1 Tax=Antarcticirhabdus aurantiaca TaxID=2606717 RepID=UPI00131C6580|nr:hypothetical protein [Antarcticirhabdus aurantiaca]
MTPLEQRVLAGFKRNGDRFFRRLPDWPNTEIGLGDTNGVDASKAPREPGRPDFDRVYRHVVRLLIDSVLSAHTLLGTEIVGDAVLVGASVVADRKADGPVYRVVGLRDGYGHRFGQLEWWRRYVMRTEDGHWICNRPHDNPARAVAEVRHSRRHYHQMVPCSMDWEGPSVDRTSPCWSEGRLLDLASARFAFVRITSGSRMSLGYLFDDRYVLVEARQANDGRWIAAGYHDIEEAVRGYDRRVKAVQEAVAVDVEDDDEALMGAL